MATLRQEDDHTENEDGGLPLKVWLEIGGLAAALISAAAAVVSVLGPAKGWW